MIFQSKLKYLHIPHYDTSLATQATIPMNLPSVERRWMVLSKSKVSAPISMTWGQSCLNVCAPNSSASRTKRSVFSQRCAQIHELIGSTVPCSCIPLEAEQQHAQAVIKT